MVAEKLSDRRKQIGMSIDQLVEKSGIPKGTLTKIITGITPNPSLESVKAIAYALGMTLHDLDDGEDIGKGMDDVDQFAFKFSQLDAHGQRLVSAVLDLEYERCTGTAEDSQ